MSESQKNALVTGGNRGIGLAIAQELKSQGFNVIVGHRSGSAPTGFESVLIDVSSTESVEKAIAEIDSKFGGVDVLVANAGITKDSLVMRMSDEDFEFEEHTDNQYGPNNELAKLNGFKTITCAWILDDFTHENGPISILNNETNQYQLFNNYAGDDTASSYLFPDLKIDLMDLFIKKQYLVILIQRLILPVLICII